MLLQTIKRVSNFPQIVISSFDISIKTCAWQVFVKTIENFNFRKPVIEFVHNPLVMSNIDVLGYFLLFLHMMLPGFLKHLALEVNIDYLVEA